MGAVDVEALAAGLHRPTVTIAKNDPLVSDRRVAGVVPILASHRAETAVKVASTALVNKGMAAGEAGDNVVLSGWASAISQDRGRKPFCIAGHGESLRLLRCAPRNQRIIKISMAAGANDAYRTREHLTEAEMAKLLAALKGNRHGHRDWLIGLLIYRHGLRVSEACDLRWDDIDHNQAHYHHSPAQRQ